MDSDTSQPGTPSGGPLQAVTQERVNQQRDSPRDSVGSVHDKISQFNNMSTSIQSKQLERKTADAALKRAMLGREEAELELRKMRDELKTLRKTVEEGKERERRVGERLETVMESYGRAKETHAHTQSLWEKEIRRCRKDTFKTQSANVKVQEELKTTRSSVKTLEETIEREKERTRAHEQEAFEARYKIVGVQEQLDEALARIKVVEQERDAFKTAAKNEEVARIAAEGRIPLPRPQDPNDEFASPPKKGAQKKRKISSKQEPRYSLSTFEMDATVATELEIEELTDRVLWEKQRADRALERVEFLEAEVEMKRRFQPQPKPQAKQPSPKSDDTNADVVVEESRENAHPQSDEPRQSVESDLGSALFESARDYIERATPADTDMANTSPASKRAELQLEPELAPPVSKKETRRSTIFYPKEGIFRTVSEQEAEAMEAQQKTDIVVTEVPILEEEEPAAPVVADIETVPEPQPELEPEEEAVVEHVPMSEPEPVQMSEPELPEESQPQVAPQSELEPEEELEPESEHDHETLRMYARTPSVDPPSFALLGQQRTSLLSLLNAPHDDAHEAPVPRIPTVPDTVETIKAVEPEPENIVDETPVEMAEEQPSYEMEAQESPEPRPHTSATLYTTVTTTVPVRDDKRESTMSEKLRTPTNSSTASFDTKNPALTPTMTREQALAKIRERRGRARSAANGTTTPAKKMIQGKTRRDMSAPQARTAGAKRS